MVYNVLFGAVVLAGCAEPGPLAPPQEIAGPRFTESETEHESEDSEGPTLILCPTEERLRTRQVIGVEGGEIELAGQRLVLPPGAVSEPVKFDLRVEKSDYLEVSITAESLPNDAFNVPVQITLSYARCRDMYTDPDFSAWHIEEHTRHLLENMGGEADPEAATVRFETEHLSVYALANS